MHFVLARTILVFEILHIPVEEVAIYKITSSYERVTPEGGGGRGQIDFNSICRPILFYPILAWPYLILLKFSTREISNVRVYKR